MKQAGCRNFVRMLNFKFDRENKIAKTFVNKVTQSQIVNKDHSPATYSY